LNDYNRGKLTKADQGYIERLKGEYHEKETDKSTVFYSMKDIESADKSDIIETKGEQNEEREDIDGMPKALQRGEISHAMLEERARRVGEERQILATDAKTPRLLKQACQKGQVIVHYLTVYYS